MPVAGCTCGHFKNALSSIHMYPGGLSWFRLGTTKNGRLLDMDALEQLIAVGYPRDLAVAALKQVSRCHEIFLQSTISSRKGELELEAALHLWYALLNMQVCACRATTPCMQRWMCCPIQVAMKPCSSACGQRQPGNLTW